MDEFQQDRDSHSSDEPQSSDSNHPTSSEHNEPTREIERVPLEDDNLFSQSFRHDEERKIPEENVKSKRLLINNSAEKPPSFEGMNATNGKQRKSNSNQPKKPPTRKRLFTWKWLAIVVVASLALMGITYELVREQGTQVDLSKLATIHSSSILYDQDGNFAAHIGDFQRENVSLADVRKVNPMLPLAFVKVEDVRFYQHGGVDFKSLVRAMVVNFQTGSRAQGGGTITMQVARNVIIENHNKTYLRKIKEIATAWNIESRYSKDQILEAYLNYIYLGNNVNGIQMASKIYFGKDITKQKLTVAEIAFLAGLPQSPSHYNPFGTPEEIKAAEKRRAIVLHVMAESNDMAPLITQAQMQEALKEPLVPAGDKYLNMYGKQDKYAAYKRLVVNELLNRYNITPNELSNQSFKIYTGLNQTMQDATEQAMTDPKSYKDNKLLDAGSASINIHTGLIAAIGGGRNYHIGATLRGAYQYEQPGSSIKPLTVYAPAIEKSNGQINEYYPIPTGPYTVDGWTPKNHGTYTGDQPLSYVAGHSINTATVWLLDQHVGLDDAFGYAQKLGLNLKPEEDKNYPALGLGGLTNGVTPLQMARAYTALANNGTYINAFTISKVVAQDGTVRTPIDGSPTVVKQSVFSPQTAYYMTRILRGVIETPGATGNKARLVDGRPAAGKTGTTTAADGASWFVGYTTDYVTAVMMYSTNPKLGTPPPDLFGGTFPAKMFKYIMDNGLQGTPIADFQAPPGVQDPQPPFILQAPTVTGTYDPVTNKVTLTWNAQDPRVTYQVIRSEDNVNWSAPIAIPAGSTTYQDTAVIQQIPPSPAKPYYYQVIATDTQASNPADPSATARSLTTQVDVGIPPGMNPLDKNGDHINDMTQDLNGNGIPDGQEDWNGDGIPDGQEDWNGNGILNKDEIVP